MAKLKIMQVGIGGYGVGYLEPMLDSLPNDRYELAGVVDPMADSSPLYPRLLEKGIPVHSTIEAFYAASAADLAVVAAPIGFHRFYTVYALEHGSHVLCEKPVAGALQDAEAMREAEIKSGRFVSVGFQWSFSEATLAAKRDCLSSGFGKPTLFKTLVLWSRGWSYYARNNWAGKLRDARGNWVLDSVAQNATAHYLHSMYFMCGGAPQTSARPLALQGELYRANDIENFDTCALRARTDAGCDVLFWASHAVEGHDGPAFEYRFEKAKLVYNASPAVQPNRLAAVFPDGSVRDYGNPDPGTYAKVLSCLDAIESGRPAPCGIEAAIPHLFTINFLGDNVPIRSFPKASVVSDVENKRTCVPGLADALARCCDEEKLPHELGYPWAAPSPLLDATGYEEFKGRLFGEGGAER
jgi:predicted dehydrogenase